MLKSLDDVCRADARYDIMVVGSVEAGIRPITLADHHAHIAAIELTRNAPTRIATAFERARNAYLYAWFVYDLTPLAEGQAYAALEMALRDFLGLKPDGKRWGGLSELFDTAARQGAFAKLPLPPDVDEAHREEYFDALSNMMRMMRNELAHGSLYLNMPGATLDALSQCAGLINQLYP